MGSAFATLVSPELNAKKRTAPTPAAAVAAVSTAVVCVPPAGRPTTAQWPYHASFLAPVIVTAVAIV